jgi:hypothetical protein
MNQQLMSAFYDELEKIADFAAVPRMIPKAVNMAFAGKNLVNDAHAVSPELMRLMKNAPTSKSIMEAGTAAEASMKRKGIKPLPRGQVQPQPRVMGAESQLLKAPTAATNVAKAPTMAQGLGQKVPGPVATPAKAAPVPKAGPGARTAGNVAAPAATAPKTSAPPPAAPIKGATPAGPAPKPNAGVMPAPAPAPMAKPSGNAPVTTPPAAPPAQVPVASKEPKMPVKKPGVGMGAGLAMGGLGLGAAGLAYGAATPPKPQQSFSPSWG